MPTSTYVRQSRSGPPRRRRPRRKVTRRNAGLLALRRTRALSRRINRQAEIKYVDFHQSPIPSPGPADNVWTLFAMAPIAQGVDSNTRIGDKIWIKYFQMRFNTGLKGTVGCSLRMLIFTLESPTSVDSTVQALVMETTTYTTPYKKNGTVPFKILYDKSLDLDNNGDNNQTFQVKLKPRIQLHYSAGGATNYGRNNLWMLILPAQLYSAPGNSLNYTFTTRIGFTDD